MFSIIYLTRMKTTTRQCRYIYICMRACIFSFLFLYWELLLSVGLIRFADSSLSLFKERESVIVYLRLLNFLFYLPWACSKNILLFYFCLFSNEVHKSKENILFLVIYSRWEIFDNYITSTIEKVKSLKEFFSFRIVFFLLII